MGLHNDEDVLDTECECRLNVAFINFNDFIDSIEIIEIIQFIPFIEDALDTHSECR